MSKRDLSEILSNVDALDETVRQAVQEAIEENLRKGNKVAAWDGNRVVVIDLSELPSIRTEDEPNQ